MTNDDFAIESIGERTIPSPLGINAFVDDNERVLLDPTLEFFNKHCGSDEPPPGFEVAGPRRKIFFHPTTTHCGIVSCGGLCPGINDVIRGLVMELHFRYGVRSILGFRYGYAGLNPDMSYEPMALTPDVVRDIHEMGGTIIGSSRGPQDTGVIVDTLERNGISILFTIGGDGTQRGAYAVHQEIQRRGLPIAIVGIPKTIDNDICYIEKTFGFETAFSAAVEALRSAHDEAEGYLNGIGLVKLMGRHSGFIAASAALANSDANFVLVPELPVILDGPDGLLAMLEERLPRRRHAVIIVAEGAGQELMQQDSGESGADASGNVKLLDIGAFLKKRIEDHFKKKGVDVTLKYIDPSYMIRSRPANPSDSMYCAQLARMAVHAGMAGKSGLVVGRWNGLFTHVPIPLVTSRRNSIDPHGPIWLDVLEATGQPDWHKQGEQGV
jgi:6-phosphofructokinase 1